MVIVLLFFLFLSVELLLPGVLFLFIMFILIVVLIVVLVVVLVVVLHSFFFLEGQLVVGGHLFY